MTHTCHWPGCEVAVPPKLWGCKRHWYALPARLRADILRHYRPGQEIDKRPSAEYVAVAKEVREWILTEERWRKHHSDPKLVTRPVETLPGESEQHARERLAWEQYGPMMKRP